MVWHSNKVLDIGYCFYLLSCCCLFVRCCFVFFFGNFLHLMTSRQELHLMNSLLLALNYCVGIILCILVSSFQFILSLLVFSQQLMFKFLMSLEDLMVKQFTLVKRLPLFVMQKNVMGKLLYCDFRLVYCAIQSTMKSTICSSEILFTEAVI